MFFLFLLFSLSIYYRSRVLQDCIQDCGDHAIMLSPPIQFPRQPESKTSGYCICSYFDSRTWTRHRLGSSLWMQYGSWQCMNRCLHRPAPQFTNGMVYLPRMQGFPIYTLLFRSLRCFLGISRHTSGLQSSSVHPE